MKKIFVKTGNLYFVILFALLAATGCQKNIEQPVTNSGDKTSQSNAANDRRLKGNFQQVNVVSNNPTFNPLNLDQYFTNPWGLAFDLKDPSGVALVNVYNSYNFFGGQCNVYNALTGAPLLIPLHLFSSAATGIVLLEGSNVHIGSNDFLLPGGIGQATGNFVGEDGVILGSNHQTGCCPIVMINNPINGYTGVTIADDGVAPFMYVANFKTKRIDVYDGNWQLVDNKPFKDPSIPSDYAPFNIQNLNNNLFVMYARTIPGSIAEQDGPGLGYVDIFKPDGTLLTSFAKGGVLNAPWGCAMAPVSWAKIRWDGDSSANNNGTKKHFNNVKSVILIGNSGDGYINAFSQDGQFLGRLRSGKEAITINGLKGLSFAPAVATTIDPDWLFFAAGPVSGSAGLFGYLQAQ